MTRIDKQGERVTLHAPFASPRFTLEVKTVAAKGVSLVIGDQTKALQEVRKPLELGSGTYHRHQDGVTVCIDLSRRETALQLD